MNYKITFLCTLFLIIHIRIIAQTINYSPAFFGPNANPVPESTDATISKSTTLHFSENYFFGFGDQTLNSKLVVEIPLLPENVSLKVWSTFFEHYQVTKEVLAQRGIPDKEKSGMVFGGDIYVQTRIRLLKEKNYIPAIILNSTLKTASVKEKTLENRRYFDTPGYYFDMEIGKSFNLYNCIIQEIRPVINVGFICWETYGRQNDAPLYGAKLILSNKWINFENSISGYYGWMKNGDAPLIYSSKITNKHSKFGIFANYKYGIHDYPYHNIEIGITIPLAKLTPKYQ